MLSAIYFILNALLSLLWWAIILAVIASNLLAFGVLDRRNRVVWGIADFLYRVTDPVLRPFRNMLPNFGGVDISPIIALILIAAIQHYILPGIFAAITTGDMRSLLY